MIDDLTIEVFQVRVDRRICELKQILIRFCCMGRRIRLFPKRKRDVGNSYVYKLVVQYTKRLHVLRYVIVLIYDYTYVPKR